MGYNTRMRVQMTEIYRDWINSLSKTSQVAHVFRCAWIGLSTATQGSIAISPAA